MSDNLSGKLSFEEALSRWLAYELAVEQMEIVKKLSEDLDCEEERWLITSS